MNLKEKTMSSKVERTLTHVASHLFKHGVESPAGQQALATAAGAALLGGQAVVTTVATAAVAALPVVGLAGAIVGVGYLLSRGRKS
jgi:hypothetical protein